MRNVLIAALLVIAGCGDSGPTSPSSCADVFRSESFYTERAEAEATFEGRLTKSCPAATPGGRDHCYFLDGTPVYSGNRDALLDGYVGANVTVRGKKLTILGPQEIWASSICKR